jgi:hypothetical protein
LYTWTRTANPDRVDAWQPEHWSPFAAQNDVCQCFCCAFSVDVPADKAMQDVFGAEYVSLHVRVSNKGAIHLYTQTLGYE